MRAALALLVTLVAAIGCPMAAAAQTRPDLSGNWIRGTRIDFGPWDFTDAGKRRFESYDFKKDDPAYGCIGASWTRVWLNPNVLVRITQAADTVRLQYEWMDIDRRLPVVDPAASNPKRINNTMKRAGFPMERFHVADGTRLNPEMRPFGNSRSSS